MPVQCSIELGSHTLLKDTNLFVDHGEIVRPRDVREMFRTPNGMKGNGVLLAPRVTAHIGGRNRTAPFVMPPL